MYRPTKKGKLELRRIAMEVVSNPEYPLYWIGVVKVGLNKKRLEESLQNRKKAIELKITNTESMRTTLDEMDILARGMVLKQLNNDVKAVVRLAKALEVEL